MEKNSIVPINKYLTEDDAVFTPTSGFTRTMIFCHGITGSGHYTFGKCKQKYEYKPYLDGFRVVFPTAKKRYCDSKKAEVNSWFNIVTVFEIGTFKLDERGQKEIQESAEQLKNIIEEEIKIIGDSRKIYLGGVSQGCATMLHVMMNHEKAFGGFLGFVGWMLDDTEIKEPNKNTPIYIALEKRDPDLPFDMSMRSFKRLFEEHMNTKLCLDDTGIHARSELMNIEAQKWIKELESNVKESQ